MYTATDSNRSRRDDAAYRAMSATASAVISPMQVAGLLLQGWRWILVAILAGAIVGVGATQLVTPRFTAITDLTISPSNLMVTPNDLYATNIQSDSQILDVESKMRTITSGNVLRRVIDKLGLRNDPEFADKMRLFDLGWLFDRRASDAAERNDLMGLLAKRINVVRQERSYVVTLSVWASEPAMSARLANSIATTFREEVVRADAERAGRVAQGLTARL
ncbi:MAG: Wzz/FepE/Etk N-terminal domain-containing protein, partial [Bradyrhizobium sp.]